MQLRHPDLNWQRGTVSQVSDGRIKISFSAVQHCRRCLKGEGCGAGVFGRLFARRGAELWLQTDQDFRPGQAVRVGVEDRQLMRAALLLYGLPLLAFILAAGLAANFLDGNAGADLGALISGLAAGGFSAFLIGRSRIWLLNPRLESLSSKAECEKLDSGRC